MYRVTTVTLLALALTASAAQAAEGDKPPGVKALESLREGDLPKNPVQNRFFEKSKRFEITPMVGVVSTNPFASRFDIGVGFGYHFRENLALTGIFKYAPDLGKGDVANLVQQLLQLEGGNDPDFQQPLDKVTLSAAIGVTWSPVYGKINILGEVVANFDFFIFAGMGLVIQNEYNATYGTITDTAFEYNLGAPVTDPRPAPALGFGANFFISQTVALRIDARMFLYPDNTPVYSSANTDDPGLRLSTELSTAVGFAFFIPKMKPRQDDF